MPQAPPPVIAPVGPARRAIRLVLALVRNGVGIVGALVFGWSVSTLILLYFADTLAGMWAVFAAAGYRFSNADPRLGVWSVVEGAVSASLVAAFLIVVIAVPLGVPVIILFGASSIDGRQLGADPTLSTGILVVALIAIVGAVRHVFTLAEGAAGDALVKRTFAILMTRWVLVLMAIYSLIGIAGRAALYVVVAAYGVAGAWSELDPERFTRLFPERRRPAAR